jgi:ParB family chromosome partitioning protein
MAAVAVTSQLVMVPLKEITPYERNPRRNDATVDKLVELIPRVGFNVPLLLDRQNVIVKGHSRYRAAQRLKMKALPCVYTDADEETKRLDRIADNRVHEFSDWDEEALARELAGLNLSFEFDLSKLNFEFALPAFTVAGSEPAPPPAPGAAPPPATAPGAPFITSSDIARTVPQTEAPEYLEVICHECGNHVFVKP